MEIQLSFKARTPNFNSSNFVAFWDVNGTNTPLTPTSSLACLRTYRFDLPSLDTGLFLLLPDVQDRDIVANRNTEVRGYVRLSIPSASTLPSEDNMRTLLITAEQRGTFLPQGRIMPPSRGDFDHISYSLPLAKGGSEVTLEADLTSTSSLTLPPRQEIFDAIETDPSLLSSISDHKLYQIDSNKNQANHFWLGHSLGCKYIALLELLTDLEKSDFHHPNRMLYRFSNFLPVSEQKNLKALLADIDLTKISIENQPSILMAPVIEGIEGAIPILRRTQLKGLKKFLNNIGFKVEPSQTETICLIQQSQLFNLTSLIDFKQDTQIAAPTVQWLLKSLDQRLVQKKKLEGKHLAPLGWRNGDPRIGETVKDFLKIVKFHS